MPPVLEVRGVRKSFGGVTAVNDVSLALERGRIYGLIGPNGSGKTTLFNCITGLERPDAGTHPARRHADRRLQAAPHRPSRRRPHLPDHPRLPRAHRARESAGRDARRARGGRGARGRSCCAFVKLERLARRVRRQPLLWPAEARRVRARPDDAIPPLILLDEPAAGVNRTLLNDLLEAVGRLRDGGKTVLLVEHDMKVVMGLCETVFVLDHGEKIAEGPPGVIQADERVIEAYFGR